MHFDQRIIAEGVVIASARQLRRRLRPKNEIGTQDFDKRRIYPASHD